MERIENAIIMAAGLASRFAPLSYEKPKALIEVKGEVMIERQIRQLIEAGIKDITVVTGYKHHLLTYLKDKYPVAIVHNEEYDRKNNISTLYKVRHLLKDTLICSADNYFEQNVFLDSSSNAYYSSVFAEGPTEEWCIEVNASDDITGVTIGGKDSWIMIGHAFFSQKFSKNFVEILESVYDDEQVSSMLWEHLYIKYLDKLKMKIKRYPKDVIQEFDSLEELQRYDQSYIHNTRSTILKKIAEEANRAESEICGILPSSTKEHGDGFTFRLGKDQYFYSYTTNDWRIINGRS